MQRLLLTALAAVVLAGAALAQDAEVYVTGKKDAVKGTIQEESPAGIKIKVGKEVRDLPALSIRQVTYKAKEVTAVDYRRPFTDEEIGLRPGTRPAERARRLESALTRFRELDKQLLGVPAAHRYVQFKIAEVLARQAEDDSSKLDAAVAALNAYQKDFSTGWEVVPCLKLLAKLQEDKGDAAGALETYKSLATVPGVPPALQQESTVLVARLLLRGGKPAEAEAALKGLEAKLSTTDPQRASVVVFLAQSRLAQGQLGQVEAPLRAAIQNTSDAAVRAAAHNLLGDYYMVKGQPEPAFWEYLYVDTLYNQDREEQAKALYHLSTLFDKVKRDPTRAKQCAERLKDKQYAGTLYQRRAAGEGK
ncbi:MAG TPA: hypothetical protein VFE78_10030 [Gemmataceae bacterium]|nr:hypothetical protein [Gemmataceae bacterium]